MKVKVDLVNYGTKSHIKNPAGVDTSKFLKGTDIASLKTC